MALSLRLQNTNTYSHHNGVKMVVYGKAGAGKTRLCATCPNPVIFSAESGLMSLREYNLPFYEIKTVVDIKECYNWARSSAEARAFETVCLDSISEIGEVSLAAALQGKKDPRQAYGEYNNDMYKILKDFRDLPGKHVYMSAKQRRFKTPDGIMINGPDMPGEKMGQQLPYLPDLIFQLDTDPMQGWPYLRTKADFANDAKDRSGCLAPMERPDLGYVINRIKGMPAQP